MGLWPRCVDDRGHAYEFQASTVQTWPDRAKRKNGVPLALGSVAVVAALAVFLVLEGRVPGWLQIALALASTGPPFIVSAWWLERQDIRTSTRLGRQRGLCLACGYCITQIEPEADGCRVCPECGAAWRMRAR
ncbi:MAG: hypothetical protein AAFV77_03740 [Planctomycetota bacterium]